MYDYSQRAATPELRGNWDSIFSEGKDTTNKEERQEGKKRCSCKGKVQEFCGCNGECKP